MNSVDDTITQLMQELSEAKDLPERLLMDIENGVDVSDRVRDADAEIALLEKRAKKILKKLGCVNPKTRPVYNAMAAMLINWRFFMDGLE